MLVVLSQHGDDARQDEGRPTKRIIPQVTGMMYQCYRRHTVCITIVGLTFLVMNSLVAMVLHRPAQVPYSAAYHHFGGRDGKNDDTDKHHHHRRISSSTNTTKPKERQQQQQVLQTFQQIGKENVAENATENATESKRPSTVSLHHAGLSKTEINKDILAKKDDQGSNTSDDEADDDDESSGDDDDSEEGGESQEESGDTSGDGEEESNKENDEIILPPIDSNLTLTSHIVGQISENAALLPKIPVVVWPLLEFGIVTAESKQIETDGVLQSPFMELSTDIFDFDPNVVWVGDTGYAYGWEYWCAKFNQWVVKAKQKRAKLGLPLQWPVFILYFGDGIHDNLRCYDIEKSVGFGMVTYTRRAIVRGRKWNNASNWVDFGVTTPSMQHGKQYRHTPLIVRTDTVNAFDKVLRERNLTLSSRIETIERSEDVSHFWPIPAYEGEDMGVGQVSSNLRTRVSRIIATMATSSNYSVHGKSLSVYFQLAGKAVRTGRHNVAKEYIEALLNTKIIVVTQRDAWEDHYRLFEGLVSGAMVMSDRMLSLPEGLKNGTHLIEFVSEEDFINQTMYYLQHDEERLAIAHAGRREAMTRHRSWHRMEYIIFGQTLSSCIQREIGSECPYIVHANQTSKMLNGSTFDTASLTAV